ncbi:putative S-adenosylmethionine-dependent methyltransferase CRG1 [Cyberlindnera fabianii]|uniref:Putative S-adenosylmethionine-dependent methyltransferase CRG1 n=1 Tax=Cyberlindnera fabianii TaxID=36022 RepID=A0A1V2LCU3_CYBFA|nr:putative S-adenosylmethionine-dependent methyltransferase CRG1 [Cyberlindnera fabianii]
MAEIYTIKDFDSSNYQNVRPTYPDSLFNAILSYHKGPTNTAVDIGSGPGTASFSLLEHGVQNVIATDISEVMIAPGIASTPQELKERIEFKVAPAEDLTKVARDGTVDLIISAEALHYARHDEFFNEAARVLRSGGTLAFWAYTDPIFVDYPKANEIYEKYVFEDDRYLGPMWSQPGRGIVRRFYEDIKVPEHLFESVEKHDYYPGKSEERTEYFFGDSEYNLKKFALMVSTWSATHAWRRAHPDAKVDIIDQLISELKSELGWTDDTVVRAEWGTTYVLARRH